MNNKESSLIILIMCMVIAFLIIILGIASGVIEIKKVNIQERVGLNKKI